MDLRQIRYFLAIVEHRGFTSAAAALHIAQPSLSHAIRALERQVGSELFVRHPKGVSLTPAGDALLGPARQIVRDFDVARDAVNGVLGLEGGTLSVVASAWTAVHPLAALIGELRRDHPRVACSVTEPADDRELITLVAEGTCELGFMYTPPEGAGVLDRHGLTFQPLGHHEYWLILPPGSPTPPGALLWEQLADVPWVAPPPGGTTRDLVEAVLKDAGVPAEQMVRADNRDALLPMVLAGAGVTMLPREQADEAATRGAVIRPLSPPLRREYGLVQRVGVLSPAARRLRDLAVRQVRRTVP